VTVDREALEHSLVRRLLDHIDQGTTDLADALLDVPAGSYTSPDRLAEDDEGHASVVADDVPADFEDKVQEAVRNCPGRAITVS
jgi:4Fe-4S single cluster domain